MNELNRAIAGIAMPARLRRRPISAKGFPVPWFVTTRTAGEWDFRLVGENRISEALRRNVCWLCGERLGRFKTFVIGPMCAINRVSAEPPSHLDCAHYAVRACPFLSHPRARRNTVAADSPRRPAPGVMLERNPGVALLWTTPRFASFAAGGGGRLIELGDPTGVAWFAEGRPATIDEVAAAIESGLPEILRLAELDGPAGIAAHRRQRDRFAAWFPAIAERLASPRLAS